MTVWYLIIAITAQTSVVLPTPFFSQMTCERVAAETKARIGGYTYCVEGYKQ